VSKEGFKNTGFNNGENHLKCFWRSSETLKFSYFGNLENTLEWEPDFSSDDGESLVNWKSTKMP